MCFFNLSGQQRYLGQQPDEEDGFDEQYFRRRPKSFCVPPGGPQGRYLPPGAPVMPPGGPQPLVIPTSAIYADQRMLEAEQQRMMVRKLFNFYIFTVFKK